MTRFESERTLGGHNSLLHSSRPAQRSRVLVKVGGARVQCRRLQQGLCCILRLAIKAVRLPERVLSDRRPAVDKASAFEQRDCIDASACGHVFRNAVGLSALTAKQNQALTGLKIGLKAGG